jgi:adenylate cyclase
MLMWSTLHPLFQAEMVLWKRGQPAELGQFIHQDTASQAWVQSPMNFMLKAKVSVFRRRLVGPDKLLDFPILVDLAEQASPITSFSAPTFSSPATYRTTAAAA